MSQKINTELNIPPDGRLDEVGIYVQSADGSELSAQDILDAVAETLLLHWDKHDLTNIDESNFDA